MAGWRGTAATIAARLRVKSLNGMVANGAPPPADAETLMAAQRRILGELDNMIVLDLGAHHGHSTAEYLDRFPGCRAIAFEADADNHAAAARLLAGRAEVLHVAVSDTVGTATFHVNSHSGTHSLYEIGAQRYWAGHAAPVRTVEVPTITLDSFCRDRGLDRIDILKMDIQGGELAALRGAAGLLSRQAIGLIALEVLFQPLYRDQPLVWDIGATLASHGYGMFRLFDPHYHVHNPSVLSWADALFLAPRYLQVPEWAPDA